MSYAPFPLVWGFFGSGGGGGGGGPAFGVIQTDFGTYPTASSTTDVLTIVSADSSKYYFTGTALTDTVTLTVNGLLPSGGSTSQFLKKQSATNYDAVWHTLTKSDVGLGNVDNVSLIEQDLAQKEPTGFPNRTDSTISFNAGTRVFSISPATTSFDVWIKGTKYTKSSTETITISTTAGNHYIYYDSTGSLAETTTFSVNLFIDNAMVSILYWNSDNNTSPYFADERHGMQMDGATHGYLHTVFGTRYLTGLALQGFDADNNTPTNASAQFTSDSGTIRDEDILLSLSAQAQIPILFRQGSLWRKKTADSFPLIYNGTAGYTGTRIPFNQFITGNWQLTEVTDGNYMMVHFFATNDANNGVIGILGTSQYANAPQARAAADTEISSLSGLPFAEFTAIGTVIFQTQTSYTNTPKARVVSSNPAIGEVYVDFRGEQLYTPSGVATSHSLLSNLSSDDHTQYHNDARGDARYVQLTGSVMSGTLETPTLKADLIQNKTATTLNINTTEPSVGAGTQDVILKSGDTTGTSGSTTLKTGDGDGSGSIIITSGTAGSNSSGGIDLTTGDSASSFTGSITVSTGDNSVGDTGDIIVSTGIPAIGSTRGKIQFDSPNINFQNWTLKLVGTPSNSDEAANKLYVDTQLATKQDTITGAASTITSTDLTVNRVVVSDSSGKIAASSVTTTTLGYLDASSSVQTQINNKVSKAGDTMTGALIVSGSVTTGNAMLRVTNTGAGDCLVVEDAANPDASNFKIDANGFIYTGSLLSSVGSSGRLQILDSQNAFVECIAGSTRAVTFGASTTGNRFNSAMGAFDISTTDSGDAISISPSLGDGLGASIYSVSDGSNLKTGINNSAPTEALDVTGNLKVSGNITATGHIKAPNLFNIFSSFSYVTPVVASTVPTAIGTASPTATGTVGAVTPTFTTYYTSRKILEYTASALSSAIAGWRFTTEYVGRGSSAGVGGFKFSTSFGFQGGFASGGTNRRFFCGMTSSTVSPSDVNPSTLGATQDMFGLGFDNGDANFQIMHSAGAANATKVNLGSSFPRPTSDKSNFYRLELVLLPNSSSFTYTFTDVLTGAVATGTVTSPVPGVGVALSPRCWISAGGVSSAVGVAFEHIYLES